MPEMNHDLAECAKVNFENLERDLPILRKHPMYLIAKMQLDEALGYGKMGENGEWIPFVKRGQE